MSDFQKWSVLAFRAMDDAGRVLMTIEPESTTEGERLDQLKQTIRELLVQALLLNGVWTRRQLDERFHFGKLDNDWLNMQLGREQQAEPVATMKMLHTYGTAPPQQQAEPIGWLDGNDKLAEFMHRDLKAEHDKRGSATPREFTVPVYAAPQQQAEPVAQRSDGMPISKTERELRRMLCIQRHGRSAYMDDGEASFCGDKYCRSIDYMRESVDSIKQAWYDAGVKKLAGAQLKQQAEPVAWYDGEKFYGSTFAASVGLADMIALRPLYTTPPQQQAEPVAWGMAEKDGLILDVICPEEHQSYEGEYTIPLYTGQPQRKPLTDEEIRPMCKESWVFETVKQWVRIVEAAHGIQEPKQ